MSDPHYPINLIEIHDGGQRRARVNHPDSGVAVWHGLGSVGEPIRPHLGHRAAEVVPQRLPYKGWRLVQVPGHTIGLPEDLSNVILQFADRYNHTVTRAGWGDLKAGDL